jgi:guanylate kinase
MNNRVLGNLFVVSSPSGGGKTSLINRLVQDVEGLMVSVSHTTRDQRPGEQEGEHYFFTDEPTFLDMVAADYFIEHARVFNHYYGTSRVQISQQLERGMDVILDIDWQGATQIKRIFSDAITVFILPPSLEVLRQRLLARQRDDVGVIEDRMLSARRELSHFNEFDYLVVNDNFEKAVSELTALVTAQRLRCARQSQQQRELLSFLLSAQ